MKEIDAGSMSLARVGGRPLHRLETSPKLLVSET